ncbi:DUF2158 domain-containing protein [Acinetobacter baumannii]|uniref:DUF2158 domain-containing protein n=1 Tax=Acinetobacter baumannii TaxID=470 RepID=UPI003BA88A83
MTQAKYSIGDTVYLKSGGHKMTVTDVVGNTKITIYTQWFVGQKVNRTHAHQDAFTNEDPNPKKDLAEKK